MLKLLSVAVIALALGCLAGCGDKVLILDPCTCDDKALDLRVCEGPVCRSCLKP